MAAPITHISLTHAESLAAELPPLLVAALRVAATVDQGIHGRRRVGSGDSFWQYRRYEPGESLRRIDWRRSARSDALYVRENEWAAAQSIWLWRDASPSMVWRSSRHLVTKAERAEVLLIALAALLNRGGERFALLGGEGRAPTTGRFALRRLADDLASSRESPQSLPPFQPLPRYGHVVLFSDFLTPLEQLRQRMAQFHGRGVRGHLVQILDPAERELPFAGRVKFASLESESEEVMVPRVESIRDDYKGRMEAHQQGLADLARAGDWGFIRLRTDASAVSSLMTLHLALAQTGQANSRQGNGAR